ncbi:MAG: DUF3187 family protein [Acidobacteria bacterium]|nr:DUF3187 family protein [Acidobacteriota bacterium]
MAYGLSDVLQFEAAFEDRSRCGGEMDEFIQGFHDLFWIEQNGRDQVAKGLFRFDLNPGGGRTPVSLDASDRGLFSRNVQVALQHNVSCGGRRSPGRSPPGSRRPAGTSLTAGGLLENLVEFDNSPDFGVHIGLSHRY